ncbi:ABC transporter substrate-binding protein [Pectobacterium actinidiae]|uniref:ABC transporter substrate-binding protein n=1 Tax=Pectobacterium actinidiae TaxID=1507808 RepID=UPI00380AC4C9
MKKTLSRRLLTQSLAVTILGAACTAHAQSPRQVPHAQGVAEISATPKRVVALSVSSLDTLDALGIDVAGVPNPPSGKSTVRWPEHLLQKYSQPSYVKISGGQSAEGSGPSQADQIKALNPDLIVLDGRGRGQFETLKGIAPTLDLSVSNASFVTSTVQNILALGTAFGREKQANDRAYQLLAKVRTLHESAAKQGTGLVLFAVANRVMPQQPDARFGMIYEVTGIRPILAPTEGQGLSTGRPPAAGNAKASADDPAAKAAAEAAQKARLEAENKYLADVMGREPDWLFVVDRNAAFGEAKAAETMAATPAIANSRAWKEKKVVYLDQGGANWYMGAGGLGLLEGTIRQSQAAFDQYKK